jgi:hypothetical protein
MLINFKSYYRIQIMPLSFRNLILSSILSRNDKKHNYLIILNKKANMFHSKLQNVKLKLPDIIQPFF